MAGHAAEGINTEGLSIFHTDPHTLTDTGHLHHYAASVIKKENGTSPTPSMDQPCST
ncbi:Uncharacterized protein DAT39_006737 [Clarias magur]|uniref:Uncharacterized protein n=1 Tax=Clarias magur TaxID=1594786 RepID=A0A8J4UTV0_CLAMG|nr:Uncharacterized protein DAT39_006737 [Clarias magur]